MRTNSVSHFSGEWGFDAVNGLHVRLLVCWRLEEYALVSVVCTCDERLWMLVMLYYNK
jgi:hypothetical protein